MGQELGNLPVPVMMDDPLSQELAQPSGGCHWGKSNQTNWRVDSESRLPISGYEYVEYIRCIVYLQQNGRRFGSKI